MKLLLVVSVLAVATATWAENVHTAYGYLVKYGIPRAEKLRAAEEEYAKSQDSRIVGGVPAALGQYPYQVRRQFNKGFWALKNLTTRHNNLHRSVTVQCTN